MASSDTDIANLALSHLGKGTTIENLGSSKSQEATVIRRLYPIVRRATLRAFAWSFARKIRALSLVTTKGDATHVSEEWMYAYRYPSDCVFDRRIQSGAAMDTRQSRVPYEVGSDGTGKLILTNRENAILEYTEDIQSVSKYPDDFVLALSLRLANYIAPQITGQDLGKMGQRAMELYRIEVMAAMNANHNEQQEEEDPASELERSRI